MSALALSLPALFRSRSATRSEPAKRVEASVPQSAAQGRETKETARDARPDVVWNSLRPVLGDELFADLSRRVVGVVPDTRGGWESYRFVVRVPAQGLCVLGAEVAPMLPEDDSTERVIWFVSQDQSRGYFTERREFDALVSRRDAPWARVARERSPERRVGRDAV